MPWLLLMVLLVAIGGAVYALSRFSLSALEEPGCFETYAATKAKIWLVRRAWDSAARAAEQRDERRDRPDDLHRGVCQLPRHGRAHANRRWPLDVPAHDCS